MNNHPNRGKRGPGSNPTPDEIKAARASVGLTQAQAGALIWYSERGWQTYESVPGPESRRMHPALWRLWKHLAGIEPLPLFKRRAAKVS